MDKRMSKKKAINASDYEKRPPPVCRDCGQVMFEIGLMCLNHGGKLYQCPEDKTIEIN